ncbi:catalase family peroxidase [Streptomyces misionensis]|uniref:catalase family peroxidase n=1 Tax=Streptomyces misionensis TaxID=67331 RepID=UPI00367F3CB3
MTAGRWCSYVWRMSPASSRPQAAAALVDTTEHLSGTHTGRRRAHARGVCYDAELTPSGEAGRLTAAAHLQSDPVRATVRFSHTGADPQRLDGERAARGFATRFHLPDGSATDLIAVNPDRFVASTSEQFLDLLQAAERDPATGKPDPAKIRAYAELHPEAGAALAAVVGVCVPSSYATTEYWAIHAFLRRDADGAAHPVKYRWEPDSGIQHTDPAEAASWSPRHLTEELTERLADGPVTFTLKVQPGEEGDPTDDPTRTWPAGRREITAGRSRITAEVADQQYWEAQSFDPNPLTPGIEASDDPVPAARSAVYAVSYDRRSHQR